MVAVSGSRQPYDSASRTGTTAGHSGSSADPCATKGATTWTSARSGPTLFHAIFLTWVLSAAFHLVIGNRTDV